MDRLVPFALLTGTGNDTIARSAYEDNSTIYFLTMP